MLERDIIWLWLNTLVGLSNIGIEMARKLKREFVDLLESDKEFRYTVAGYLGLSELLKRFEKNDERLMSIEEEMKKLREDLNKIREDMNRGFELVERRISALGARWGFMTEEAFREGVRGLLDRELGIKVERWSAFDASGIVYGHPSQVEVDVSIHDGRTILIEISSHVRRSDVSTFIRKATLYKEVMGKWPDRLLIVTPYIEEDAYRLARELKIEIYTKL